MVGPEVGAAQLPPWLTEVAAAQARLVLLGRWPQPHVAMLTSMDQPLQAQHLQAAGFEFVAANAEAVLAVGQGVHEAVDAKKEGVGALLLRMLKQVDGV